jgi:hypothetical protein
VLSGTLQFLWQWQTDYPNHTSNKVPLDDETTSEHSSAEISGDPLPYLKPGRLVTTALTTMHGNVGFRYVYSLLLSDRSDEPFGNVLVAVPSHQGYDAARGRGAA